MSMNEDLKKYPVFRYDRRTQKIYPADYIKNTEQYDHYNWQMHHFVRKTLRKTSLDFYKRVEHLQKMILMPTEMNLDLEYMGEESFFKKWKLKKNDLVFSRLKWREGYYDNAENTQNQFKTVD